MPKRIASIRARAPLSVVEGSVAASATRPGDGAQDDAAVAAARRRALETKRRLHAQRTLIARQTIVLRAIVDFHEHATLAASLGAAGDGIRRRFGGERVGFGLRHGDTVTVASVSQQAVIDPVAPETRLLAGALDEGCRRAEQLLVTPAPDAADGAEPRTVERAAETLPAHRVLVAGRPDVTVVTTPLCHREEVVGALLVESVAGTVWNAARLELLQQVADTLAPMIVDRRAAELGLAGHARDRVRETLAALRAPRRLVAKLVVVTLAPALLGLALVPFEQRVAASAELVPTTLRTVTAPTSGYVARVAVGPGDAVREGEVLFELDTRDLVLERDRWRSELAGIASQLRATRAAGERKRTAVLTAQRERAAAELALVEQRIARATVRAPHDGRVLSGELERMTGAAVERGQGLVELAPDGDHAISLLVDERDVALLAPGQPGTLALQARPGEPLAFTLGDVHPIAVARDGRNRFRVEAVPSDALDGLLPGQTGVAKVLVGRAGALHIVTRRFTDWARIGLWSWFGG